MAIVVIKLHKPAPIAANGNAPIGRRIALPTDLSTPRPRAVNASAAVPMRRASVRSNQRGAATIRLSINCVSASFSAFFGQLVAPGFSDRISEMQAVADNGLMLALFSLGGGEMILILAAVLILFGAKKLPELARGLGEGISQFHKATRDVINAADDEVSDAGRSLGGIYGKPAAQALTVDNQVAELYDPAALRDELIAKKTPSAWRRLLKNMWCRVIRFLAKPRTRMQ